MATVKVGTTKLAKRVASADELAILLTHIPKVNLNVVQTATEALLEAADHYMASQLMVDSKGRRSKPNLADARAGVAALHKHLANAIQQLSDLPLDALTAIGQVTNAPLGKMRADIEQVRHAVETALAELNDRPHKVADAARCVLAYQVAVVFRDLLHVKPTSTSDKQLTPNMSTARGGAAYARVLRATLKTAGVTIYDARV
jgi:Holliday junction resolvasome RuvABC endonuclease subunit